MAWPKHPDDKFDQDKRQTFLDFFAHSGNVVESAKAASVDRITVYRTRTPGFGQYDEQFAREYEEARMLGVQVLEAKAMEFSIVGYDEYVLSAGKLVMDPADPTKPLLQRKYNPMLMIRMLEAHDPDRYKPSSKVEHAGGVTINIDGDDANL